MRIFSIHKSKSKKQVSEKTPKLAAQKFLEKRKVGTVIYLHEHPSGKIHGPYRKEYDKKIMKGGFNDLTCEHFKILENLQLLEGTTQLIIKEERISSWRHRFLREPLIFFGDSTFMQENIPSYTYALYNSYGIDIKNKNKFVKKTLTCYKVVSLNSQYRLQKVQISEIENNILLGLYYQYIERCKQEFPSLKISRDVQYYRLYMKRLFLYLLLYVLPKLNLYFLNIIHENQDETKEKEKEYYTNIVDYVTNIDIDRLLSIFITSYDMPPQFKEEIMKSYLNSKQSNANENANENMVENAMRLSVSSQDIESRLEQPQQLQQSSSGSGAVNLFEVIPLLPIIIPAAIIGIPIGIVVCGTMHLAKQIAKMIKKNTKRN